MNRILLLTLFVLCVLSANAQKVLTFGNAGLVNIKLESISKPLKSLPDKIPTQEELNGFRPEKDNPSLERPQQKLNPKALPIGVDPALQINNGKQLVTTTATTATILSNFTGLTAAVQPSDNTIAVGKNHIVQMTNNNTSTYIRVLSKTGTILVNSVLTSSITGITDYGDPNIIYDEAADRYLFVLLYSKNAKKLVVCISQTPDPTGAWFTYTFATANGFPDYPKLGVWGNSYFITTNSSSPTIFALNRSAMIAGIGMGTAQVFSLSKFPTIGFQAASPVTFTGSNQAPAGSPATMIRVADDAWSSTLGPDHIEMFQLNINWSTPSSSTISGPFNLNTIAYNSNLCGYGSSSCIPQPGSTSKLLDPLSDIFMDKVQYRNMGAYESILCSHVCNADGSGLAGVRWYELRKSGSANWSIYQQSTWSPNSTHRWMSSIAMNQLGQIALGYNISSASVYPGIAITGRDSCDALNTMTVPETIVKAGAAANSSSRYGDYNGLVVDPADGTFWFTANYNPTANWATNIVHFSLNTCTTAVAANNYKAKMQVSNDGDLSGFFEVYPNPANDLLNIQIPQNHSSITICIIDVTGKQLLQKMVTNNITLLDIHTLPSGVYLVKLTGWDNKSLGERKFIKK